MSWKKVMAVGQTVIVVGGGVVGAAIALALSKNGWQVSLFDRGPLFSETSSRAGGLLGFEAEAYETGEPPWLDQARDRWGPWIAQLEEQTGLSCDYGEVGIVRLLANDWDVTEARRRVQDADRYWQVLEGKDLPPDLPVDRQRIAGAVVFPSDARLDPRKLGEVLGRALADDGVDVHTFEAVREILVSGGRAVGVDTSDSVYHADWVVVAAGCQSPDMMRQIGCALSMVPVKGQVIALRRPPHWPSYTVQGGDAYLIPRVDNSLLIGATYEEGVRDTHPTLGGFVEVAQGVLDVFPSLHAAPIIGTWAGTRPVSQDDLPYIGSVAEVEQLLVASGHGARGMMLAPWTADIICRMASGDVESEWTQFSPLRRPEKFES